MLFLVLSPSSFNIACLANCLWQVSDRPGAWSERAINSAYLSELRHIEGCNQKIVSDCAGQTNYVKWLGQLNSGGKSQ